MVAVVFVMIFDGWTYFLEGDSIDSEYSIEDFGSCLLTDSLAVTFCWESAKEYCFELCLTIFVGL